MKHTTRSFCLFAEQHRPVDRPTMDRTRGAADDVTADAAASCQQKPAVPGDVTSSAEGPLAPVLRVHSLLRVLLSNLEQDGTKKTT